MIRTRTSRAKYDLSFHPISESWHHMSCVMLYFIVLTGATNMIGSHYALVGGLFAQAEVEATNQIMGWARPFIGTRYGTLLFIQVLSRSIAVFSLKD